jgi:hypothetical protein
MDGSGLLVRKVGLDCTVTGENSCVQVWRLGTNFLYFGSLGLDYVLHTYFMCVG